MVNSLFKLAAFDPLLSIVSSVLRKCQLDNLVVRLACIFELYGVLRDVLEVLSCFLAGAGAETFVVLYGVS